MSPALALLSPAVLAQTPTGQLLVRTHEPIEIPTQRIEVLRNGLLRITPPTGQSPEEWMALAQKNPGITWIEQDLYLDLIPATQPDDPWLEYQWHHELIRTPQAWDHTSGSGILIAVLDTGVATTHPDLAVIPGHDYIDDDDDPNPVDPTGDAHGTAVAGVAAGTGNNQYGVAGVAWGAEIYAIRLIGGSTSISDIYNAFVESVDAGASVINNSWSFGNNCDELSSNRTFTELLRYAEEEGRNGLGTLVVFASGNDGCELASNAVLDTSTVLTIGAIDANGIRQGYSNFGATVDLAAPANLLTTDLNPGGYGSYQEDDNFADGFGGTSSATPVVAGAIALILAANPNLTAAQVRTLLCQTATRNDPLHASYDETGHSPYYGCGLIDAGAAVAISHNTPPTTPEPTGPTPPLFLSEAILSWTSEDIDNDRLSYEVIWTTGNEDILTLPPETTSHPFFDLRERIQAGDTITWSVRAHDGWSHSEWSPPQVFILEKPSQKQKTVESCSTVTSPNILGLLALSLLLRNRREAAPHPSPPRPDPRH